MNYTKPKFLLFVLMGTLLLSCEPRANTEAIEKKLPVFEEQKKETSIAVDEEVKDSAVEVASMGADSKAVDDECVFDLSTQNADFLEGIDAYKGFRWDDEKHTAFGWLENGDSLAISRGGCTHFNYYLNLTRVDSVGMMNWDYWFEQSMEYAMLLPDFDADLMKRLFEDEQFEFEKGKGLVHLWFKQDDYCSMDFFIEVWGDGIINVEFGYYLC